jgi:MFS family permease
MSVYGEPPRLGLRANWRQFTLLVVVNAFVGGMVGLERSILPLLAEQDFALASKSAILSFIVSFGLTKALANLTAGSLSDRIGRKAVLVAGWLAGLPVPALIIWAPSWSWVVAANVLLGINQGLCWSTTIIMKIDLVGPARRGLAMGLNEFAGYVAVAGAAFAAGYLAGAFGLRPYPFLLGLALALAGLLLCAVCVCETQGHARYEAQLAGTPTPAPLPPAPGKAEATTDTPVQFWRVFLTTSWQNRTLFAVSQAGMVNNLNDGMAWGLFPLLFAGAGLRVEMVGLLAALYPASWGILQLATGTLSDRLGRKGLIVGGMWLQAAAIALIALSSSVPLWATGALLLGAGTAMVYPTLLAAIGDVAHPSWRATAVGVYRLWRDAGYAIGALLSGVLADALGLRWTIGAVAMLTFTSGAVAAAWMRETLSHRRVPGSRSSPQPEAAAPLRADTSLH